MKAISSGVILLAAMMMSPSFSRSASSTTTTGRPAAMSAIARSTLSRWMSPSRSELIVMTAPQSRLSTYLAITSTSRLTWLPGCSRPSVVSSSVVGIRLTSNHGSGPAVPPSPDTVRLTPSTVTEPLSTTYRRSSAGSAMRTTSQCSPGARDRMTPVPSACPWTRWPPSRPPSWTGRSRLTGEPGASAPSPVRCRVSAITSAVNVLSVASVTVRQTPLTAIESPCRASAVTRGPRTVSRAASASRSTATISPSSSTIPVNIRGVLSSEPFCQPAPGDARTREHGWQHGLPPRACCLPSGL